MGLRNRVNLTGSALACAARAAACLDQAVGALSGELGPIGGQTDAGLARGPSGGCTGSLPLGQRLATHAATRPTPRRQRRRSPYRSLRYETLVDEFIAATGSEHLAEHILSDNPARLYGFRITRSPEPTRRRREEETREDPSCGPIGRRLSRLLQPFLP